MSLSHPRKIHKHFIFVEEPHPCSYASLIRLNRQLARQTDDHPANWEKFRKKMLQQARAKHGTIKCEYCGRTNLKMFTKDKKNLATLDHVVPKKITRKKIDPGNIKVACCFCNQEKQEMSELQFRKHLFFKAIRNNRAAKNIIKLFFKYCFCSLKLCLTLVV
jgi:hypothetical protein